LQNLFSLIRGRNGFNDKPELSAFVGALRSIATSGLIKSTAAVDAGSVRQLSTCEKLQDQFEEQEPINSESAVSAVSRSRLRAHSSAVLDEPLEYLAGYILSKSRALNCEFCRLALTAAVPVGVHIRFKTFEHAVGGLTNPSEASLKAFRKMEAVFTGLPVHVLLQKKAANGIAKLFRTTAVQLHACPEHEATVRQDVCIAFARLRLRQWCREQMRSLRADRSKRKTDKKLNKLRRR
jgi:hypothetical protein